MQSLSPVIKMMWIEKETYSKYYKCGCGFTVTIDPKPFSHLSGRSEVCGACKSSESLKLVILTRIMLVHKEGFFKRKLEKILLKKEEIVINVFSNH